MSDTSTAPPGQPRWTEYIDVDDLKPDPRNPKGHADSVLDASLERFGFTEQVMIDERTGLLSAGHGRRELVMRRRAAGDEVPDGVVVTDDGRWLIPVERGWSSVDDDEALAYLVTSNRSSELGGWEANIRDALEVIAESELGFAGTGYVQADLDQMIAEAEAAAAAGASDGTLLGAADVSVGEPKHVVEPGQRWKVGRHTMVCADLMNEHHLWRGFLTDGVLFCPYPGPFVALGSKVQDDAITLLLVQPDPYIAGHILDKWAAIHGTQAVELVK